MHPSSLANLELGNRFQSGDLNPRLGGRKEGSKTMATLLERALEMVASKVDPITRKVEDRQMGMWVAIGLTVKAASGDVPAIREIFDRIDGKATQKWEVSGNAGGPLQIEHSEHLNEIYTGMKDAFGVRLDVPASE